MSCDCRESPAYTRKRGSSKKNPPGNIILLGQRQNVFLKMFLKVEPRSPRETSTNMKKRVSASLCMSGLSGGRDSETRLSDLRKKPRRVFHQTMASQDRTVNQSASVHHLTAKRCGLMQNAKYKNEWHF